jgi:secondary thiamine-phosphate synthase enzyme
MIIKYLIVLLVNFFHIKKMIRQKEFTLTAKSRGFHLVTSEILTHIAAQLTEVNTGIAHIHIKHTSASLTINENADPTVREDFEQFFNRTVPENVALYKHTLEGTDDMTSHIKASLLGNSVSVPITNGRFNLGTWQGIYLCEHRNHGGQRKLVVTLLGS